MSAERARKKDAMGFSLVDVLVSLFLISTTAVVVMSISGRGAEEIRFQKRLMMARDSLKFLGVNIEHTINIEPTVVLSTYEQAKKKDVLFANVDCKDGCNSTQIAQLNMHRWTKEVVDNLPNASYEIEVTQTSNVYDVVVSLKWFEAGVDGGAGTACTMTVNNNEVCITDHYSFNVSP